MIRLRAVHRIFAAHLSRDLVLLLRQKVYKGVPLGADEEGHGSLRVLVREGSVWLAFARTRLKPRDWRYHSLTELSVDLCACKRGSDRNGDRCETHLRDRSKRKRMAMASLQTSGNMLTRANRQSRSPHTGDLYARIRVALRDPTVRELKATSTDQVDCGSAHDREGDLGVPDRDLLGAEYEGNGRARYGGLSSPVPQGDLAAPECMLCRGRTMKLTPSVWM
jgi:hypothetical protein